MGLLDFFGSGSAEADSEEDDKSAADYLSGFGSLLDSASTLAAKAKSTAESVGAVFNPQTQTVTANNTAPSNFSGQTRDTFGDNATPTWWEALLKNPLFLIGAAVTGFGVVGLGAWLIFKKK